MTPSTEELLAIARKYWPADEDSYLRGERSPEAARLEERWNEAMPRMREWRALVADLQQQLPGFSVREVTTTSDACFRCAIYPPQEQRKPPLTQVAVGCMSVLAPVCTVYGLQYEYRPRQLLRISNERLFFEQLPTELREPAEALARQMEARFGVSALPPEVAATPVPLFVDVQSPPRTTLFHALFSSHPLSVP